jgi:ABC-type Mn2+/Zn2+ transport system ATPase subunit
VQAGILDLLRDLRDRLGTAILFITHDMGVVADLADGSGCWPQRRWPTLPGQRERREGSPLPASSRGS